MRRRDMLTIAGTGAVASLAGCTLPFTGGSDDDSDNGNGADQPPVSEVVELADAEIARQDEGTFAEKVRVDGTGENTADVSLSGVQARVRFLDENGEELSVRESDPRSVGAGNTFSFSVEYQGTGSDAQAVQDFDVEFGQFEDSEDGEDN